MQRQGQRVSEENSNEFFVKEFLKSIVENVDNNGTISKSFGL